MKIDDYAYGVMVIDGKAYSRDLIIFPDRIKPDWWRKEGHSLSLEDLVEVIEEKPKVLIIGTGDAGFMRVPLATKLFLKEKDIELIVTDTPEAVQVFNKQIQLGRKVAAAFHLTC